MKCEPTYNSESKFYYDTAPVGLAVLDTDLRYVHVNESLADLNGLPVADHIGRTVREVLPALADQVEPPIRQVLATGEPITNQEMTGTGAGEPDVERTWLVSYHPLIDSEKTVSEVHVVVQDITRQKRAEAKLFQRERELATLRETLEQRVEERTKALQRSKERLTLALKACRAGMFEHEYPLESDVYHNDRWFEMLGYQREDLPTPAEFLNWFYDSAHPVEKERLQQAYEAFINGDTEELDITLRLRHKSGEWCWVHVLAHAVSRDEDGRATRVVGATLDITEEKRNEAALRRLATQLTRAEQADRRRIAAVLHDDLQQWLFSARISLNMLGDALQDSEGTDADTLREQLHNAEAKMTTAVELTRNLSVELSPPVLESDGLGQALRWLASQMQERHHLTVDVDVDDLVRVPDQDLRLLLFRNVRELLFNVVKHANVSHASVVLQRMDGGLRIEISDSGVGFDVQTVMQRPANSRGLVSVRERLELVGGHMDVVSQPGEGARVTLFVPIGGNGVADDSGVRH